jgi:hypothetical protein
MSSYGRNELCFVVEKSTWQTTMSLYYIQTSRHSDDTEGICHIYTYYRQNVHIYNYNDK